MSKVVNLRPTPTHNQQDPVFFAKEQIKIGTKLRYCGRTNPNGLFTVIGIVSSRKSPRTGNWLDTHEETTQKLGDRITVLGPEKDRRTFTFGYLSYSAIWRLGESNGNA